MKFTLLLKYFSFIFKNIYYAYQEVMGNRCISPNQKFINVSAQYFIDHAAGSYQLTVEDLNKYNAAYNKYILKQPKLVGERRNYNKAQKQLLESLSNILGIRDPRFNKAVIRILKEHNY